MKVLIVARTIMGSKRCVGGLTEKGESIRLLPLSGECLETSIPFKVGQVYEIDYVKVDQTISPHIEDVRISKWDYVKDTEKPFEAIIKLTTPWAGDTRALFDGRTRFTGSRSLYISKETGIPDRSTWFWIPDKDLMNGRTSGKNYYYYYYSENDYRRIPYVGEKPAIKKIPSGTIVRVSLARWWKPDDAGEEFPERCYVQLSGWFDNNK